MPPPVYDGITYPFGMYAGDITDGANPNPTLYTTLGWGCLVNFFYVPGAFVGAWLSDWMGPKRCMIFGLVMQAIFGFALSGAYNYFKKHIAGFAIFYGICECYRPSKKESAVLTPSQSSASARSVLATTSASSPPRVSDQLLSVPSCTR